MWPGLYALIESKRTYARFVSHEVGTSNLGDNNDDNNAPPMGREGKYTLHPDTAGAPFHASPLYFIHAISHLYTYIYT